MENPAVKKNKFKKKQTQISSTNNSNNSEKQIPSTASIFRQLTSKKEKDDTSEINPSPDDDFITPAATNSLEFNNVTTRRKKKHTLKSEKEQMQLAIALSLSTVQSFGDYVTLPNASTNSDKKRKFDNATGNFEPSNSEQPHNNVKIYTDIALSDIKQNEEDVDSLWDVAAIPCVETSYFNKSIDSTSLNVNYVRKDIKRNRSNVNRINDYYDSTIRINRRILDEHISDLNRRFEAWKEAMETRRKLELMEIDYSLEEDEKKIETVGESAVEISQRNEFDEIIDLKDPVPENYVDNGVDASQRSIFDELIEPDDPETIPSSPNLLTNETNLREIESDVSAIVETESILSPESISRDLMPPELLASSPVVNTVEIIDSDNESEHQINEQSKSNTSQNNLLDNDEIDYLFPSQYVLPISPKSQSPNSVARDEFLPPEFTDFDHNPFTNEDDFEPISFLERPDSRILRSPSPSTSRFSLSQPIMNMPSPDPEPVAEILSQPTKSSFTTPKSNRRDNSKAVEKTPNYIQYDIKQLQTMASRYGIRKCSKTVLVSQLEQIWRVVERGDPQETRTPPIKNTQVASRTTAEKNDRHLPNNLSDDDVRSNGSDGELENLEPDLEDEDDDATAPTTNSNPRDPKILITTYIRNNAELHSRILRYEPVHFESMLNDITNSGLKCKKKQLLEYLDTMGVNYIIGSGNSYK
ncbi:hypothetical protein HK098_003257 [Nowakowskiella sp. JEL0407]|nr:hypothetical protein HK098_003257 [Nowakowskiella sp. JEL0407]